MEARLKNSKTDSGNNMDQRLASAATSGGSPRSQRPPVANAFDQPPSAEQQGEAPPPLPEKDYARRGGHEHNRSRPGTARQGQRAVPGALPPTPVASEGE